MAGRGWRVLSRALLAAWVLGCGDSRIQEDPTAAPAVEIPPAVQVPPTVVAPPVVEPPPVIEPGPREPETDIGPSAACHGLMPMAAGVPEARDFSPPPHAQAWCSTFAVDGQGNLAWTLMQGNTNMGYAPGIWTNLDAQGHVVGQREDRVLLDGFVAAQAGFLSVESMAERGFGELVVVRPDASTVKIPRLVGWGYGYAVAAHARHGLASVERSTPFREPGTLVLQAFDAAGQPRFAPVELDRAPAEIRFEAVVGIDDAGRLLVLWRRGAEGGMRGRWYGGDGQPLTESFDVPAPNYPPVGYEGFVGFGTLTALQSRGLVLRHHGRWVALFPSVEARVEAPPTWLAARPATSLALVRGGRAYAMVSSGGHFLDAEGHWVPAPCPDTVELLTLEGESCGTLSFPAEDGSCGAPLRVGADGTLLQQQECRASLWPGLLR